MSETDGVGETLDEGVRVAVVAAGRTAEALVRMREQQLADARAQSEAAAREYTERLHAERQTARAHLEPVHHQQWWDRADAAAIGQAYTTARAWQDLDPEAAFAHDRIRDEVRRRYSIDVDKVDSHPAAVREAMALSEALRERVAREGQTAQAERARAAAALQEVDRADRAAQEARERAVGAGAAYDSAERREEFARAMRRDGVPENLIAVRLRADLGEARPATDIVATAGRGRSVPAQSPAARQPSLEQMPVAGGVQEPAVANRPGAAGRFPTEAERAELQRDVWDASPQQRSAAIQREAALVGLSPSEYQATIQPRQINDVVKTAMAAERGFSTDVDTQLWNDWRVEQALMERHASGKPLAAEAPVLARREPAEISQRDPYDPELLGAAAGEAQRARQTPQQYLDNLEVAHHAQITRAADPQRTAAYNQLRMLSERRVQIAQARAQQNDHDAGRESPTPSPQAGRATDRSTLHRTASAPDQPQAAHGAVTARTQQARAETNFPTTVSRSPRESHPTARAHVARRASTETGRSQDLSR